MCCVRLPVSLPVGRLRPSLSLHVCHMNRLLQVKPAVWQSLRLPHKFLLLKVATKVWHLRQKAHIIGTGVLTSSPINP